MDKQNNSPTLMPFSILVENFWRGTICYQVLKALQENINLLLVGAAGSGKAPPSTQYSICKVAQGRRLALTGDCRLESDWWPTIDHLGYTGLGRRLMGTTSKLLQPSKAKLAETIEDNRRVHRYVLLIVLDASAKKTFAGYLYAR